MNWLKLIVLSTVLMMNQSYACLVGESIQHINPDGSLGGWKSKDSKVASTSFVSSNAKICDKALVEGNARILGYAVIKENAWIRDNAEIRENAIIGGNSIVWGKVKNLAIVRGHARVYGSAKILNGTIVTDNSEVFGGVSLYDSDVRSKSKVCETIVLKKQSIFDDYFCSDSLSRGEVKLVNYNENSFNKKQSHFKLIINSYNFSLNTQDFNVTVNGSLIDQEDLQVSGNILTVLNSDYLIEGKNQLHVLGRDEFGKKISSDIMEFIVGFDSKEIEVGTQIPGMAINFDVEYTYQNKKYGGLAKFDGSSLFLEGLPSNLTFLVELKGIGSGGMISESFESIQNIPSYIEAFKLPPFENNELNFENGLKGWYISHPENLNIEIKDGKKIVTLLPDQIERIEIAKTFNLASIDNGLGVIFDLPPIPLPCFLNSDKIFLQVILASKTDGEIKVFNYSHANMKNYILGSDGFPEVKLSLAKKSNKTAEYNIVFRLMPADNKGIVDPVVRILKMEFPEAVVNFTPLNLFALNKAKTTINSTIVTDPDFSCSDPGFNLLNQPSVVSGFTGIYKYFSAGPFPFEYPIELMENRIFGSILLESNSLRRRDIQRIELVGIQNNEEKIRVGLAKCSGEKFDNFNQDMPLRLLQSQNLVDYLFRVSITDLMKINTEVGSQISLHVEVFTIKNKIEYMNKSIDWPLSVIKTPLLPKSYYYGGVDHYNQNAESYLRTGGDKWILPSYSNTLINILTGNSGWLFNDLSKLNGGPFPIHAGHLEGRDADIRFKSFISSEGLIDHTKLSLLTDNDEKEWGFALNKIESLVSNLVPHHNVIETIYMSQKAGSLSVLTSKFIDKKFQYRCLNGRYVDFSALIEARSLLNHEDSHADHLHIQFNQTDFEGSPILVEPIIPESFDLDDLKFEYVNNKLKIEPIDEATLGNINVVWRMQDKDGFNDLDMMVEFGEWPEKTKARSDIVRTYEHDKIIKTLYISGVTRKNGGCVERVVKIDFASLVDKTAWTYTKLNTDGLVSYIKRVK